MLSPKAIFASGVLGAIIGLHEPRPVPRAEQPRVLLRRAQVIVLVVVYGDHADSACAQGPGDDENSCHREQSQK